VISLGLSTVEASKADLITHMPAEVVASHGGYAGLFGGGWLGRVLEPFAGAWQRNIEGRRDSILSQSTVWSCITLIVQDIGKLGVDLIEKHSEGIWLPTTNTAYSPVLRRPNHYQGWIKFIEAWVTSKLTTGNTYVLKERDNRGGENRGNVVAMYVLNPALVQVKVAPRGDVFYTLSPDNLSGLMHEVTVPASEIIHDVAFAPYHPLCGLPPLVACALAASQSLSIQYTSSKFFQNNSKPGGVLTAPGNISDDTAKRIKEHWDANYAGEDNYGKVAVLGNGLKYEAMAVTNVEAQLIDQLKWTDEKICAVFHIPPFMVGVGPMPTYDNIAKLNQQYYQQALQELIECIEECLDRGLGLADDLGIRLDIDNLLRMDQQTLMETLEKGKNYFKPNEGRRKLNLPPVEGGDAVYRQQQDFSLPALAKRDAQPDPFKKDAPPPAAAPASAAAPEDGAEKAARLIRFRTRSKAIADRYRGEHVKRAS
jgi:HK97 family phage portal protein